MFVMRMPVSVLRVIIIVLGAMMVVSTSLCWVTNRVRNHHQHRSRIYINDDHGIDDEDTVGHRAKPPAPDAEQECTPNPLLDNTKETNKAMIY